jgi:hypothetical protein
MPKRHERTIFTQKTGRIAFLFLLLFVLSTFVTAFHHHKDGCDHPDCPVCVAAHHHSAARVGVFSFENPQPIIENGTPSVPLCYKPIRVALLLSRAPPV